MRSSDLALALLLAGCGSAPPVAHHGHPRAWDVIETGTTESFRGLALPAPGVIWASGTHGTVLRSTDGGAHSDVYVVPTAETLDFRSLHAWDASRALVLSAGSPARAFLTTDGGASWSETYTRQGEGVFFDSLAFRDASEGLALGDPLPSADGPRFALLVTHDGGAHWQEREGPRAETGEAAFAASNACIAFPAAGAIVLATGGAAPRVFRSSDDAATWSSAAVPIPGSSSAGIFAIAFASDALGYATGGDYAAPDSPGSFAVTRDGGATWTAATLPRGYRSSVAVRGDDIVVVGTSGSDVSYDQGASWTPLDELSLNAVRILGDEAIAVGPEGHLARLAL